MLGLGYPGGPAIQRVAASGDATAFGFPVAMSRDPGLDFSFSGLKTALVYAVRAIEEEAGAEGSGDAEAAVAARRDDLAASFQAAVVDQLIAKIGRALDAAEKAGEPWPALALGGGVAANSLLRERAGELCERRGIRLKLLPIELCTDNAAMIGAAATGLEPVAYPGYLDLDAAAASRRVAA